MLNSHLMYARSALRIIISSNSHSTESFFQIDHYNQDNFISQVNMLPFQWYLRSTKMKRKCSYLSNAIQIINFPQKLTWWHHHDWCWLPFSWIAKQLQVVAMKVKFVLVSGRSASHFYSHLYRKELCSWLALVTGQKCRLKETHCEYFQHYLLTDQR